MEDKNKDRKKKSPSEEYTYEVLPDEYSQYDLSFKLIIIGDSGVGKTCLTSKAAKDDFHQYYQATIGFEFLTFNVKVNDCVIKLQIWDTCGQEMYRSLISNFYRNSSLAVMVYAIDDLKTFESMESWLNELKTQSNPDVKIFLVGNKSDLEEERKVERNAAEQFAIDNKLDLFLETSAKTGFNAKNVLIEAAKVLYKDYLKYKETTAKMNQQPKEKYNTEPKGTTLSEEKKKDETKKESKCCK